MVKFFLHENFSLNPYGWGSGQSHNIIAVLDSAITEFFKCLIKAKISGKEVNVISDSILPAPFNHPRIIKTTDIDWIYLTFKDTAWCQYAYQFLHELCHHIIASDFFGEIDDFGWLEESLCELTSLFFLKKITNAWQMNPPYPNWYSYATSFRLYANEVLSKIEVINTNFDQWIIDNISNLRMNRYNREQNAILGKHFFPLFITNPELWQTIHYIKEISVYPNMDFFVFLDEWNNQLPMDLKHPFSKIILLFSSPILS